MFAHLSQTYTDGRLAEAQVVGCTGNTFRLEDLINDRQMLEIDICQRPLSHLPARLPSERDSHARALDIISETSRSFPDQRVFGRGTEVYMTAKVDLGVFPR
jgi:hypothetical protein